MALAVEVVRSLSEVDAAQWDALAGEDDPFIEHAFLHALELSGSVGGRSGWLPVHLLVRDPRRLVAALPLYLKLHSYGEYIFDWSWANAAERAGLAYYPKLVSMVPFTPATGRRLLLSPAYPAEDLVRALWEGVVALQAEVSASSVHLLFLDPAECALWTASAPALMPRLTSQFHWHNEGDRSFDDYLARFRSSLRKQVRRERRQVEATGLEIRVLEGPELGDREWRALHAFYVDTCQRRGSGPYLTPRFFEELRASHARRVVAVFAFRGLEPIAATLNFQKGKHLYGRYWGAAEEHPGLHFELCYYRLIERAIEQGLTRFEAGAQGSHKLRRGLLPAAIHSAHAIAHPGLASAVGEFLRREREAMREELAALAMHGPFHRD